LDVNPADNVKVRSLSMSGAHCRLRPIEWRLKVERKEHWNEVYQTKASGAVSWFQAAPQSSLAALNQLEVASTGSLIDVGGGTSTLVDTLLNRGWSDLTVLDISQAAIDAARSRLGSDAERVRWEVVDIMDWKPSRSFDVWHDRAVFHFLMEEHQRQAYRRALEAALAPYGFLVIATFAPDGPQRCSGLPVRRYDEAALAKEFGPNFRLLCHWREAHRTPAGRMQNFIWCMFRKEGAEPRVPTSDCKRLGSYKAENPRRSCSSRCLGCQPG
jgi:trans-aconitate methyltransferase